MLAGRYTIGTTELCECGARSFCMAGVPLQRHSSDVLRSISTVPETLPSLALKGFRNVTF